MFVQKLKILFISPSFPRQSGPEAFVNGKLVLAFLRLGWHVDVITQDPSTVGDDSLLWQSLANYTHSVRCRFPRFGFKLNTLFWIVQSFCLALRLHKQNGYQAVLSRSQPIWGHVLAYFVTRRTRLKWLANWNDPSPIQRYPPPYGGGPDAPISLLSSVLFKIICNAVNRHTFPCERLKNYMLSYMPHGSESRASVIPHISAEATADGSQHQDRAAMPFVIRHSGSIFFRNWYNFLLGLSKFLNDKPATDILVEFIGWQPEEFRTAVNDLGLAAHVTIMPAQNYEESLLSLHQADVLLIIEAGYREGIFLPSKVADYAETYKPILAVAPSLGTLADLVHEYKCGISADCDSVDSIQSAITQLYDQWQSDKRLSQYNLIPFAEYFSTSHVVGEYLKILHAIEIDT